MLTEAKANNNRDKSWLRLELLEARSYTLSSNDSVITVEYRWDSTYLVIILCFVLLRYQ